MFAAGILVLGWIGDLGVRCRRAVETALLAGAATAACLYAFEAISANWLTRTGRGLGWEEIINSLTGGINVDAFLVNGVVVLTLAIWPVMAILGRRGAGGWAAVAPLVLLAIIARHGSTASLLALVGGLGVAGLARLNARWTAGVLAGLFALTVLSAPLWPRLFLAPKALPDLAVGAHRAGVPNSAVGRLLTWRFTGEKILERPFLGWGLDSSRALPGGNAKYHIRFDSLIPGRGEIVFHDSFLPLHPHSQPLQIWLELGAFGAAIVALLGGWVLWRLGDGGTREPPAVWAPGLAVAILVFAGLSFGAWQSWWIASQFLAAALMWMAGERGSPSPSAAGAKNISR
jgi:O-antigen ligase